MKAIGVMIFLVAFFLVMLVTSALPTLPPGRELAGLLGISLADIPSSGIPIVTLLTGFFNGIVYGATAMLGFALATWMPALLNRNKE